MPALSALGSLAQRADQDRRALDRALDGLRKIALGHCCDFPVNIARSTLREVAAINDGRTTVLALPDVTTVDAAAMVGG